MALIQTEGGDLDLPVTLDQPFMETAEIKFDLPVSDPLIATGALNYWRPVTIAIYDGGDEPVAIPGYVVAIESAGGVATITVQDASVQLKRRTRAIWNYEPASAGQHVIDLMDGINDEIELHGPTGFEEISSPADGYYTTNSHLSMDGDPASYLTMLLRPANQTVRWRGFGFAVNAADSITQVRVRVLGTLEGPLTDVLTARVRVSWDGGSTWGSYHDLDQTSPDYGWFTGEAPQFHEQLIDVTADTTWTSTKLSNANLKVEVNFHTATNTYYSTWYLIAEVGVELATNPASLPDLGYATGTVEIAGDTIKLPTERHTPYEWLQLLVEKSGQEWRVRAGTGVGDAILDWQERIGGEAALTVETDVPLELGSLEEGQYLGTVQTALRGLEYANRVRVMAPGLPDYVLDSEVEQTRIGQIHETIITLSQDQNTSDQQRVATETLARLSTPTLVFDLPVPRTPGLWSALAPGNTLLVRLRNAPYDPWEGKVRIVKRAIDEQAGMLTASVIAIEDRTGQSEPTGTGTPIVRTVTSAKRDPRKQWQRRLETILRLTLNLARR